MNYFDSDFESALEQAQDVGIAPVFFVTIDAADRTTGELRQVCFWTGDYNITHTVTARNGDLVSRLFVGAVGMQVGDIKYVLDGTDNSVSVSLNPLHDAVNTLLRTYDARLATVEIHVTTWTKGRLASIGELRWVGMLDTAPYTYGAAGEQATVSLAVRSELMVALGRKNPAKSSDEHQKRRLSTDTFCQYSGVVDSFTFNWYKP